VFLTTHYMDEAEHLAHRVAVIAGGRIVAEGTPAALRASVAARSRISLAAPERALPPALSARFAIQGDELVARVDDPVAVLHELTRWAVEQGVEIDRLQVVQPTLEDVYLSLVGEASA
jgi:ABC-2 type transport system ATP-binding protein